MKFLLKLFFTLLFLAVFAGTLYFLYEKSKEKPIVYQTEKPFITDIVSKAVATGSIVPRKEIEIKPQISGVVEKIFVEPGDMLKKNALIARLEIIPDMISLNNAETRLNQARISLKNAETEFKRRKKLYDKKIITEAEYIQYETTYNSAMEEVEAAESNLQLIRKGTSRQSKETTNTLIRSTINGMVLDIPVEEGDSVRVGIDDFALRLFGPFERIEAPLLGREVKQGRADISMFREEKQAKALSPVSGVVTSLNPKLREEGHLANEAPYSDGWIMIVKPENLRRDLKTLMIHDETGDFMAEQVDLLYREIEATAGPMAADGGHLGHDIYGHLPRADWRRLARLFLKT